MVWIVGLFTVGKQTPTCISMTLLTMLLIGADTTRNKSVSWQINLNARCCGYVSMEQLIDCLLRNTRAEQISLTKDCLIWQNFVFWTKFHPRLQIFFTRIYPPYPRHYETLRNTVNVYQIYLLQIQNNRLCVADDTNTTVRWRD